MKLCLLLLLLISLSWAQQCQFYQNAVSGTITADGTASNQDCTYSFVPPSQDYNFLTLHFSNFNTEYLYDFVTVYDGPSDGADVIAKLSGALDAEPTMSTSQPYATVRFTTDAGVASRGWTVAFQYYKRQAPSCAGPKWITDQHGSIDYGLVGADNADPVSCEWIFTLPPEAVSDDCSGYMSFTLTSWEDTTNTAVVSFTYGPSPFFDSAPKFDSSSDSGSTVVIFMMDAATLTSFVTPFDGSNTYFSIQYDYTPGSPICFPDDSSSDSDSDSDSDSWSDSDSDSYSDSDSDSWSDSDSGSSSGSSSSSGYFRHPYLVLAVVLAAVVIILIAIICCAFRCFRSKKTTDGYQQIRQPSMTPMYPNGNLNGQPYVIIPMMPHSQQSQQVNQPQFH